MPFTTIHSSGRKKAAVQNMLRQIPMHKEVLAGSVAGDIYQL